MLYEIRQMAAKLEGTEGVAETIAAADAKVLIINPKIDFDVEMKERPVAMKSFSHVPQTVGRKTGQATGSIELKGSGVVGTAPEWAKFLRTCGVVENTLKSVAIGAISGGPFVHGETITGAGGGKGRVILKTTTGAAVVYYVVVSGVIGSSEVITGSISAATATTAGAPATAGIVYEPTHVQASIPSMTIYDNVDGLKKEIRGARGNAKLNFKAGEPVTFEFNHSGVKNEVVDEAHLGDITYESVAAPAFMDGVFKVDGSEVLIQGMDVSIDNTLTARDDVNDAEGIKSFAITGRKTSGSFDPEMQLVAGYDFYGKWFAGTAAEILASWGDGTGKNFTFYVKSAQYSKVNDENSNGLARAKANFLLNGTKEIGNDEWALLCL